MSVEEAPFLRAHVEPENEWRVPSGYARCRRPRCQQAPVADMRRSRTDWKGHTGAKPTWWAYCADHLREYNREVRDGRVWWLGQHA